MFSVCDETSDGLLFWSEEIVEEVVDVFCFPLYSLAQSGHITHWKHTHAKSILKKIQKDPKVGLILARLTLTARKATTMAPQWIR